ncbi:MAG: V-type ATP synthase subunit D [Thermoprotei archaeon]|nr:MAG: V-type ATP synthase subunit D [Thermoprotei archaeon]
MSQQVLRISRPTKLELIRLRRRLAVARRLHRILRDRLTILMQEFLVVLRKLYNERERLHKLLEDVYADYRLAVAMHGVAELLATISPASTDTKVVAASRNVAGVRVPMVEVENYPPRNPLVPPSLVPLELRKREVLDSLTRVAELEKELILLGREMERTKRRVNMLEHVLIPRIERTIRYLMMKFEEREREEKVRLKRVKTVLARRRGE